MGSMAGRDRGAAAVQLLVILVPVLFGLMGFALDLGQLYLVRGELQTAANAMALGAASQLRGTDLSSESATAFARLTLENSSGFANKYYFGGLQIGQTSGFLNSEAPDPSFFATAADAIGIDASGGEASGAQARHVRVQLTADAPLTFWGFLSLASERKIAVTARAVAGMSAPLCTACGIEPLAVAAVNAGDTVDFGFIPGITYTLGYVCNGAPTPQPLPGTAARIPYLLLNRQNFEATILANEQTQLYRVGSAGLPPSTTEAQACFTINTPEQIWVSAAAGPCASPNPGASVVSMVCGMTSRFEATYPTACAGIPDIDTVSASYPPDSDTAEIVDYAQYQGNGRRVITIAVVDTLNAGGDMAVVGFRQFLVQPMQGGFNVSPSDSNGRFGAMYIGSVAPIRQGRFSGCQQSAGPGKVVLHQ